MATCAALFAVELCLLMEGTRWKGADVTGDLRAIGAATLALGCKRKPQVEKTDIYVEPFIEILLLFRPF